MNPTLTIRLGQLDDAETIAQYNSAMALETEEKALEPEVIHQGVKNLINNPQYGFYLVAEMKDQIAGTLMITTEWSDWRNGHFWWIQSVFIPPEFRRKGIFRKLYEHSKQLAKEDESVCGLRLYVEKENVTAQSTYSSLGMSETAYKLFEEEF